MNKTHKRKRRPGYSLAASVCSLGLGLYLIFSISAQTPCPTIPIDSKGFPKGTTVYYSLDGSITNCTDERCNGQVSQLTSAITAWDTANQSNNSGVRFQPADANHPATLTFKNNFTAGTSPPA
jgi:hypothetical protein